MNFLWVRRLASPGALKAIGRARRSRPWAIIKRTTAGSWTNGFVHAGNIAYLSLLTLFPFFIVVASFAGGFGRTEDGLAAVHTFLRTLPKDVAGLIAKPIAEVIKARSSNGLLTFGVLVTLWTVSGFIETIRDIIRKSYEAVSSMPVWRYRIASILLIIGAVVLMLIAFIAQVILTGVEEFVAQVFPTASGWLHLLGFGRLAPALALFVALYLIFYSLTPKRYRNGTCPIWPGALLTMVVWIGTTMLLPLILSQFGGYSLTYGSLAGVIVALLFFYIIGFGLVFGAHLNAALAIVPKTGQKPRAH
ncbi:YihY/virulence factor BrkB family protein [Glacieibacterium sp.]|uniref:YihY/virulence factor BrkB family protein n=1 Tax=Glacieibacterium sp. TaxID=2860237 RepID=UPI003B00CBCB